MSKQNKFFAAATTAALVASAIVPVASAAEFKDANQIAPWAKEAVETLAAKDIIGGNPDGSFNPKGNVTRAEAAKMFKVALDLPVQGTESFTDVKDGQWFQDVIIAVSNAGIVDGMGNGLFVPNGKLTRAEAAKMIVKAYGFEGEADLSKFADADKVAGKWFEAPLSTAVAAGIIAGKGNLLAANDSITRQEFAVMLTRAIDTAQEANTEELLAAVEKATTALDTAVKALNTEVKAEEIAAAKAEVVAAKDAITALEKAVADAKDVITTEASAKATTAIEAAKKAIEATEAVIAKAEEDAKELAVESISAINAKEVQIKFGKALDKNSALLTANYELNVAGLAAPFTVKFDEKTPDTVTLVATSAIANNSAVKVTVKKGIMSSTFDKLDADKVELFVANDKVAPSISTVEKVGNDVVVTFTEHVASVGLVKFNNSTIAAGSGSGQYAISANKLTIKDGALNLAAGEYELVLGTVADTTPTTANTAGLLTGKVAVVADTVKPVVTSVTQLADNQIKVTFNKAVDPVTAGNSEVTVTKNGYALNATAGSANTAKTEYTYTITDNAPVLLYATGESTANIVVKVNGFKDAKNTIADSTTHNVTLTKDAKAPAVVTGLTKITNVGTPDVNEVIDITFDKEISLVSGMTGSNVVLTDSNGVRQTVSEVTVEADGNGDNKVLRLASSAIQATGGAIKAGEYTITLPAGLVEDTSSNKNKNLTATVKVTQAGTTTTLNPTVTASNNVITVAYAATMNAEATKVSNYLLDGKALPEGSVAYFNTDNQTVKIEIPKTAVKVSGGGALTINDAVQSTTGTKVGAENKVKTFATGLVDGVAPELIAAKKVSATTIELTFSEAIVLPTIVADAIDDLTVKINGIKVTPSTIAEGSSTNKLVLTVATYDTTQEVQVSTNAASSTVTINLADTATNLVKSGLTVIAQ